jgi:hypothetical protein
MLKKIIHFIGYFQIFQNFNEYITNIVIPTRHTFIYFKKFMRLTNMLKRTLVTHRFLTLGF